MRKAAHRCARAHEDLPIEVQVHAKGHANTNTHALSEMLTRAKREKHTCAQVCTDTRGSTYGDARTPTHEQKRHVYVQKRIYVSNRQQFGLNRHHLSIKYSSRRTYGREAYKIKEFNNTVSKNLHDSSRQYV